MVRWHVWHPHSSSPPWVTNTRLEVWVRTKSISLHLFTH